MYHIGICDDEPVFLENITEMTKEILTEFGIEYDIRAFSDSERLMEYLRHPDASLDLLLLDILMGEQTGIELAHALRGENNPLPIIFITSTAEFALEGYKTDAIRYLLKPVQADELKEAILCAWQRCQSRAVVLSSPSRTVSFHLDNVLYMEIYDKELSIHLADGGVLQISLSLNSVMAKLPQQQFIQCHRSYVVSLPAIVSIWRYGIELENQEKIPVSKAHYATVQNALLGWVSEM